MSVEYANFFKFYTSNLALLQQMIIPFISFFSFVSLRKDKYNYAQNVIFNTYLTSHFNLLNILLVIVSIIFKLNYNPPDDDLLVIFWSSGL